VLSPGLIGGKGMSQAFDWTGGPGRKIERGLVGHGVLGEEDESVSGGSFETIRDNALAQSNGSQFIVQFGFTRALL